MTKRKRLHYTPEFKADAVKLIRAGGWSIAHTARDLDLREIALREWVRWAKVEAGEGPPGALGKAEREESVRLWREKKRPQKECDMLKK